MTGVFISYRRGPTSPYAGRLHDRLTAEHGRAHVFMDVDAIAPGVDFAERITSAVAAADATLVVIGPDWLTTADAGGRRRVDDPADFVHLEVAEALRHRGLVVPVLVQGARMPALDELPEPLRELSRRNAVELRDARWASDVNDLATSLRQALAQPSRPQWRRWAVAGGILVAAAALLAVTISLRDGDGKEAAPKLKIASEPRLGGYPVAATITGGTVWVVLQGEDRLKRIDARTAAVADSRRLGTDLSAVGASPGHLWVGAYGSDETDNRGTVVPVDPATGDPGRPIRTLDPFDLAADDKSLWVLDQDGVLDRIDVKTRRRTAQVTIADAFDLALADGTVWVVALDAGLLYAFDADTGRKRGRAQPVGARPFNVAAAGGYVWITTEQGQLIRIAAQGGERKSVAVGGEGRRWVETDGRSVWVADEQRNVLLVDPRSLRTVRRMRLPSGTPEDIAPYPGGAWVLSSRSGAGSTIARIPGSLNGSDASG
jgi:DNA-binding beta-propeller fold protein YncE